MKRTKLIILILVSIVTCFIGRQLQSIYGFDPPYIYFYSGFVLGSLSILVGIVSIIFLVINLIKEKGVTKIRKVIIIFGLLGMIIIGGLYTKRKYYNPNHCLDFAKSEVGELDDNDELKNGDIIFQTSLSRQSNAIQLATNSKYSHCGLIYKDGKDYYVFEAIQPVKTTQLDKWIARGKHGKYVIKRLKNADKILTPQTLSTMKQVGDQFMGKNYDLTFEWSDDKIYCSELIWKIYQRATGLEVGKLETLRDFDLSDKAVKEKMKERYGENIPMDEIVISPISIFDSKLLEIVKSNE